MNPRSAGTLAALLLLVAGPAHAGAWVHDPGDAWLEVGWRHTSAKNTFDQRGRRRSMAHPAMMGHTLGELFTDGRFVGDELSAYAEVGVLPGLELYGRFPVRWVRTRWDMPKGPDILQRNTGAGDAFVGVRGGGQVGRVALSLHTQVRGPLYDNRASALNRAAGDSDFYDDRPPLGQGTIDVDVGGAAGVGLGAGWAQVEQAVRFRDRRYSTALPGMVQAGVKPVEWVAAFGEANWQVTLSDGQQPTFFLDEWNKSPLVIDRQHHLALGAGTLISPLAHLEGPASGLGVSVRYDAGVVGRRSAVVRGVGASLFWSL